MRSSVVEFIIDERLEPARMTENALLWSTGMRREPLNTARTVFKNYVLSCEVFHVDSQI
ncbi:MAG: hypothetical protein IPK79_04780 [Vampirovibrionales bacterium]|nr:hypothetical protein [Vampirovibrionales bacterium]